MTRTRATSGHGATTRLLIALACALVLLPLPAAHARLGDLDPLFDGDGMAFPNVGPSTAARFDAMTSRPDGRPIAAGWATSTGGIDEPVVMQLTNEGVPDNGFGVSGLTRVTSSGPATQLHAVALDAGSVLAAGNRRPSATSPPPGAPFVMRLTPTGGVDTSFADDLTNFTGELTGVLPVAEDKVLAGGWRRLTGPTAVDVFFLARLNDTGTLDQTFGNGGFVDLGFGPAAHAEAMAWGPGERIVLAGWALAQGVRRPALARFNADGSPDLSFGTRGTEVLTGIDGELRGISVDGVGRITAAGISGTRALVIRRLENGGPDPAFGTGGETYRDAAALNGLALDGSRSLVPGRGEPSQLLLGSLDGAGAPEAALGGSPPGWRTFPGPAEAFGVALGPGGTVYTAGGATTPFISRHLPNAAPTAALASPAQVLVGEAATFDAVGSSDPEGEQLRYAFDLDGNGTFEFDGGTNPLALRSFPAPGNFNVGVQVTDPRGGSATATRAIAVVAAPEPIPQPVLGKQGVAKPLSGIVRYRLPGTKKFVRLVEITAIPNGTEIDARKGRLLITVLHDASGQLDGARFYAGRFIFRQGKGATPITTLKLTGGSFKNCTVKGAKASSVLAVAASVKGGPGTRSKRRVRKLWGDGRGRFRTRGRYGAATVRGTKWLTLDRCDGTKVRVVRGKVSVQDLVRPNRKPKLVKAGGKAFVRYKRGG